MSVKLERDKNFVPIDDLTRRDLQIISNMVDAGSRVLDIGCGNGALLDYLGRNKGVDGRGIELSQSGVNACVANGLSVIQGDADTLRQKLFKKVRTRNTTEKPSITPKISINTQ